jgi:hypothetical protein
MSFVFDNSALCGLFLANQTDSYTEAIASRLVESQTWAPPLLQRHWINDLRIGCRRGVITLAGTRGIIKGLATHPSPAVRQHPAIFPGIAGPEPAAQHEQL